MQSLSLTELLRRAWQRHHSSWWRLAMSLTGNSHDAEDVLQEALLRVLRAKSAHIRTEDDISWYVLRAIRTVAIDHRREGRVRAQVFRELLQQGPNYPSTALEILVAVEEQRVSQERLRTVETTLAQMKPALREAVQLYYLTEPPLGIAEIAEAQGVSTSAAYERIQRGLRILSKALSNGGHR